jgi:hypothetical protein
VCCAPRREPALDRVRVGAWLIGNGAQIRGRSFGPPGVPTTIGPPIPGQHPHPLIAQLHAELARKFFANFRDVGLIRLQALGSAGNTRNGGPTPFTAVPSQGAFPNLACATAGAVHSQAISARIDVHRLGMRRRARVSPTLSGSRPLDAAAMSCCCSHALYSCRQIFRTMAFNAGPHCGCKSSLG